jgi:hypothetical protein
MDNLKLPAYPGSITGTNGFHQISAIEVQANGFTKLELASLMIAQGLMANPQYVNDKDEVTAKFCTELAKAVLEEANK